MDQFSKKYLELFRKDVEVLRIWKYKSYGIKEFKVLSAGSVYVEEVVEVG